MKRRKFLQGMSVAAAAGAIPLSLARVAQASLTPSEFTLWRADSAEAGARFLPVDLAPCIDCASSAVRVRIDALHAADGGAVLEEFWLSAMFDVPGAEPAPFLAWQHVAGSAPRRSQRLSFVAPREGMRGFELDYRLAEESECTRERCALTTFTTPLIAPGHYVLTGPRRRRKKKRIDARGLCHSGNVAAPLQADAPRDYDYFAFRIEALG